MEEMQFCQSYGIPLTDEVLGIKAMLAPRKSEGVKVFYFTATDGPFYTDFYPRNFIL
jgi:hypothetical protein